MGRDLGGVGEWLVIHFGQLRHHIESFSAADGKRCMLGPKMPSDSLSVFRFVECRVLKADGKRLDWSRRSSLHQCDDSR